MHSKIQLKNGVEVVYQKLKGYQSVSIGAFIKTGTMHERPDENGISHFIEHMLFKGTKMRSAEEISLMIDRLGGELNAFTAKDCTCFYTKLLSEDMETGFALLSDMLSNSCFNSEAIAVEKSVIIDEINMYEDSAEDVADELLTMLLFGNHALGLPILGNKTSVMGLSRSKLLDYYAKHYRPERMLIAVSGNFDETEMIDMVTKYFETIKAVGEGYPFDYEEPELNWGIVSRYKENEQIQVAMDFPGISYDDPRNYEMMMLSNLFGGTNSSMLFQNIREKHGLTYAIYAQPTFYEDTGTLNVSFGVSKENLNEIFKKLADVIVEIKTHRFSKAQVLAGKAHLKGSFLLGLEGTENYMDLIGRIELFKHQEKDIETMLNKIEHIDADIIDTLIDYCFGSGKCAMSIVGEIDEREANEIYNKFIKSIQTQ